jgi:hypothetical protein
LNEIGDGSTCPYAFYSFYASQLRGWNEASSDECFD